MTDSLFTEMGKTEIRACFGESFKFGVGYVQFEIPSSKPPSGDVEQAVGHMCIRKRD